jgi:hypothetical protein
MSDKTPHEQGIKEAAIKLLELSDVIELTTESGEDKHLHCYDGTTTGDLVTRVIEAYLEAAIKASAEVIVAELIQETSAGETKH